jgi:hypothetical protein
VVETPPAEREHENPSDDRRAALCHRLADRIRERRGFDVDLGAAEEVRRTGWSRPFPTTVDSSRS